MTAPHMLLLPSCPPALHPFVCCAVCRYVQVEYGPMELDLNLRARIHCLEQQLAAANVSGLVETNAGVRSVMIEYDARQLTLPDLLKLVSTADARIGDVAHMVLPSRIVHLPMAFEERWVRCVGVCCSIQRWSVLQCPARIWISNS